MKIKTIITTTITNNSLSSRFFSFEVTVLLFLAMFLPFTTTNEIAVFTVIEQEVWAFKPTVPSDQNEDQQQLQEQQEKQQEENVQQVGNQTGNSLSDVGNAIGNLFK